MSFLLNSKIFTMKHLMICTSTNWSKMDRPVRLLSSLQLRYPNYETIYQYPLIRVASLVNKLKFFQFVVTGAGIPVVTILAASSIITTDTAILFAANGLTLCATFCAVGFLGHNRVGFIYLKDDQTSIKIAYTNFWGKRVDTEIPINDIWPLSDLPTSALNPFYYKLKRYSNNETLKFNIKGANIINHEKFRLVFGDATLT